MEDIVKEIIKIDSVAFDTKQKSEQNLELRKKNYEEEIENYKKSVLEDAEKRAKEIYNQILNTGNQKYMLEQERSKKEALLLENRYLQVESALLDEIFNKLFIVEG